MKTHCHIDQLGGSSYRVRVTAVTPIETTDGKGRTKVLRHENGDELLRFDHTSELRGAKLRIEAEAKAAALLKEKGVQ